MIQALQLILALSFLVVIHEFGHFTFARLFKVRVEKFYMFFNPKISLLRMKRVNGKWQIRFFAPNVEPAVVEMIDPVTGAQKKDEKGNVLYRPMTDEELQKLPADDWRRYPDNTEWGIGWVPFGGYCSIAGMVDETKSATDLPSDPQPWEFRAKNVWQRLGIISGGILVNFIAALLICGQLLYHWGTDTLPLRNVTSGLYYSEILQQEGFEQQDRILTIDGQEPEELADVVQWLIIEGKRDVVVLRGSDTMALTMSEDLGTRYLAFQNEFDKQEREKARRDPSYKKFRFALISEYVPFVVDTVLPNSTAYYAGLQAGDSLVAVNGVPTGCDILVNRELRKHPCDSVQLTYYRAGEMMTSGAFLGDQTILGAYPKSKYAYFEMEHKEYGLLESIPAGVVYGWDMLKNYVKQFRLVFTKEGAQSLGGFGAIGGMFPSVWNWYLFWYMTAFLSLILAFMNFLPIPALDGGYILFLLVEILTGKQPSDKFLEKANNIGFILLIILLIYANGNDLFKLFF